MGAKNFIYQFILKVEQNTQGTEKDEYCYLNKNLTHNNK